MSCTSLEGYGTLWTGNKGMRVGSSETVTAGSLLRITC